MNTEKEKTFFEKTKELLKEKRDDISRWWFYNNEIIGCLSIIVGLAGILIFLVYSIFSYYENNYNYCIKSGGKLYWVNEMKLENGIITFQYDGREVRLSSYELQDNRKIR